MATKIRQLTIGCPANSGHAASECNDVYRSTVTLYRTHDQRFRSCIVSCGQHANYPAIPTVVTRMTIDFLPMPYEFVCRSQKELMLGFQGAGAIVRFDQQCSVNSQR